MCKNLIIQTSFPPSQWTWFIAALIGYYHNGGENCALLSVSCAVIGAPWILVEIAVENANDAFWLGRYIESAQYWRELEPQIESK